MTKRNRKNENGVNISGTKTTEAIEFFSSLPDNVFTVIFSFLTFKEAVYACISCSKLKHLMTLIPNIEFNETGNGCLAEKRKFVKTVSKFLNNHDGLVKQFQLSFRPLGKRYWSVVCDWLSLVVKNGLEELDLTFNGRIRLMIPTFVLTAATLKVLKLRHCTIDQASITSLKSMKSLLLGSVNISDSVMGLIIFHCESLQDLTLENCSGFTDIEIVDPGSKLETLILNNCLNGGPFGLKVVSLKKLCIRQKIMNFLFMGSPHIDHLALYREGELPLSQLESEMLKDQIIESLGNVRSLKLDGMAFECFTAYRSNYQLTKLEEIHLLDFNVCLQNITGLTNLISQAEGVTKLLISINENTAGDYDIGTDFLDYESERRVTISKNTSLMNSAMRTINIQGFKGTSYELTHIKFMVAHFRRLRILNVTPIKEMHEDRSCAYGKAISRFPRISADVTMRVGCWRFNLKKSRSLIR